MPVDIELNIKSDPLIDPPVVGPAGAQRRTGTIPAWRVKPSVDAEGHSRAGCAAAPRLRSWAAGRGLSAWLCNPTSNRLDGLLDTERFGPVVRRFPPHCSRGSRV